jgi:hypothetical protein
MKSITVLLVGQVRNQHVLLRMVENLAAFREKGLVNQVILSTWTSEIPKIRHLLPQLDAAGVTVKRVDEPVANLSAPGNIVNQMRGVDLALETVEDTAWVLRARPDLWVDFNLIAGLAAADMSLDEPGEGILAHKIWTPFVELCQPMCVSDIAFFGHYADIVKLQNFDSFHEVAGTNLGTSLGQKPFTSYDAEIRRYTPAFSAGYPVLQEYYRISNRFFLGVHELRHAMLATLYDEDFYWQYMAAYFDILKKYFWIGRDILDCRILLVRPENFDQTHGLGCVDFSRCDYARQVLASGPDAASTKAAFADAPVYCNSSDDVNAVYRHLERIGIALEQRLDDALNFRKDAARIVALRAFRQKLLFALDSGIEKGRPMAFAWQHPFSSHFIDLPGPIVSAGSETG